MICKYCGAQLRDDAKFCTSCGNAVRSETASTGQTTTLTEDAKKSGRTKGVLLGIVIGVVIVIAAGIIRAAASGRFGKAADQTASSETDRIEAYVNVDAVEPTAQDEEMEAEASAQPAEAATQPADTSAQPAEAATQPADTSAQPEVKGEIVVNGTPFWGIYAYATQDYAETFKFSDMVAGTPFSPGFVMSNEWANLNPDPWFCLCLGFYETEEEALAELDLAKQYFPDAYVKYSGACLITE